MLIAIDTHRLHQFITRNALVVWSCNGLEDVGNDFLITGGKYWTKISEASVSGFCRRPAAMLARSKASKKAKSNGLPVLRLVPEVPTHARKHLTHASGKLWIVCRQQGDVGTRS